MPISARGTYTAEHWTFLKTVYQDAVRSALGDDVQVDLVSEAEDAGLIHERIVSNIYKSDIVVCDVSGGYPNVFLEAGLGLAWDKPMVLVIDDQSKIEFDIGGLEHTIYNSSRAVPEFDKFRAKLKDKISGTYRAASSDPSYSPFMRPFLRRQGIESQDSTTVEVSEVLGQFQKKIELLEKKSSRPPFTEYKPQVTRTGSSIGMDEGEIVKIVTNKWIYENVFDGVVGSAQLEDLVETIIAENPLSMRHGKRSDHIREKALRALEFFGVKYH